MALKIHWTPKATTWIDMQLAYWEENEQSVAATKFFKDLDKKLKLLVDYPETGRATNRFERVRFVIIDKHYNIFYRIKVDTIVILTFFDTHQSPNKKPF
jgi:plasmid stabilization system protein ParE